MALSRPGDRVRSSNLKAQISDRCRIVSYPNCGRSQLRSPLMSSEQLDSNFAKYSLVSGVACFCWRPILRCMCLIAKALVTALDSRIGNDLIECGLVATARLRDLS